VDALHPEKVERLLYAVMVLGLATLLVVVGQRCDRLSARISQLEVRSKRDSVVLRYDTPVYQEWKDPATGEVLGTYRQTLYDYAHSDAGEARQDEALENLYLLVNKFVTDPTMRGHLMRHDVTREQLDTLAKVFGEKGP
jgi:hypothetical protein